MTDISLVLLCHACPILSDLADGDRYTPSRWLTAGYVPCRFANGSTGWQRLIAREVAKVDCLWDRSREVAIFYHQPSTRLLLERLAVTFAQFFWLSAEQWEADLRRAPNPITHLCLWQTAADQFDYYTRGKQFSLRARQEYLDTLWLFFNYGPEAAGNDERLLHSLTLGRVKRVVAELERYFQRRRRDVSEPETLAPASCD